MSGATILMPAAFKVNSPITVIRDQNERILQYVCGLVAWAEPQRLARIVFVENSGTSFDFGPITKYLRDRGKELEVLVFQGATADIVKVKGQGIGEGEVLEHGFTHSRFLREAESFYKVTGRIYVRNFDDIDAATSAATVIHRKLRKPPNLPKANTVFFKVSREVFESRLLHAYHDIDEPHGKYFEHAYYAALKDIAAPDFSIGPLLVGQQASTGKLYEPYSNAVVQTARSLM